jgi:protein-tyrosine phosphatase
MTKVLMICLGNICRSPLAEGILKSKLKSDNVFVDSAGTGGWHVGNLPDKRSIKVAAENGIDLTKQRCRKFEIKDFDTFDYIYVMDSSNYQDIISLARNKKDKDKVHFILKQSQNVPDPYYGGTKGFENVYNMLDVACNNIIEKLNLPKA